MDDRASFRQRMLEGLSRFHGQMLLLISGRDLTASEFMDLSRSDTRWRAALRRGNVDLRHHEHADHTFAVPGTLERAIYDCTTWLNALSGR